MQRRNTSQRQIVYDALAIMGHATTESLIEYIQKNFENISLATIYRNISILIDEEMVKRVKLQGEDVLETVKQRHGHFICRRCHQITDIDCSQVDKVVKKLEVFQENQVENYDMAFYGVCQNCKKEEEK